MGLDVNLYRYDDFDAYTKYENELAAFESGVWKKYPPTPGSHQGNDRERWAKIDVELNAWKAAYPNKPKDPEAIEIPSSKYPDHTFYIGYFRSSYNGVGFNSVLKQHIGLDLYTMFDPPNDYVFRPKWPRAIYLAWIAGKKFAQVDALKLDYAFKKEYYAQGIEIVIETIEWVLNQPHPEQYALHWSS